MNYRPCLAWDFATIIGNLPVIRQNGESQNGCFKKACQIFRKINISYPLIRTRTCACQVVRNVCFSENLPCFVFLKYPIWDSPFCLITEKLILCSQDCQQNKIEKMHKEFLLYLISLLPISFYMFYVICQT